MFVDVRLIRIEMLMMDWSRSSDSILFKMFKTPVSEKRFIGEVMCPNGVFIPNGRRLKDFSL